MVIRHPLPSVVLLGALSAWASTAAATDIDSVNQFRNVSARQTGDSTLVDNGAFFSASATVAPGAVGSYANGHLSFGVNVFGLNSSDGGRTFSFQTASLASQAELDASFPVATIYAYTLPAVDSSAPPAVATLESGVAAYPLSTPQLTGGSFSALQGMNASAALTLNFSPFIVDPNATEAFVFLSIYDQTSATWFFPLSFAPPSTSGVTLAAGQLAAGHSFSFELIYSDRVLVPGDGTNFRAQMGFDFRTEGDFATAAVPEPQSWALLLAGLALLGVTAPRAMTAAGRVRP